MNSLTTIILNFIVAINFVIIFNTGLVIIITESILGFANIVIFNYYSY